jgi:rubrerythrin
MAPEMFDGTVTPRSDVYAIGICLFELLAGMKPFRGSMNEIAVLHKTQPLPLNTLERTGVSPGLLEIIERATNKNPIYRFKSAAQMARAMRETAPSGFNAELARTRLGTLLTTSDNNETATQLEGDFSTSYFERISALADQRSDARTPEFPPELNENETSNSSTIARPQRRLFREPLQLKACPRCEYDLAGLPRRHQCPECGFPYDENMFTVHAWYRERLSMPGRLAFARSWVSKAYYALLILFFPVLILSSIVIRSWQSKNWQGSILSAVFWGGLIVLGVTRAFFYSRTRRKKKGTLQVLFTSEGVAERRKGELSRCMRWENFRYFRFRRKGKNLWRLRLCGRFWGRFIHAGVLRRWLKNPGFWVELEASPRVAAFVRSEIRRRLPHGVSPRRNRKTKVVNPSLEPVKGGG